MKDAAAATQHQCSYFNYYVTILMTLPYLLSQKLANSAVVTATNGSFVGRYPSVFSKVLADEISLQH